jgi:PAS domain S-box-containing protein
LFFASGIAGAALVLFLAVRIRKYCPGFVQVVLGVEILSGGIVIGALRGYVPDALSVLQVAAIAGFALVDSGIQSFCARPQRSRWAFVYVLASMLILAYLSYTRTLRLRIVVTALLLIPVFIDTALPLLRAPPEGGTFGYRFSATVLILFSFAACLRIVAIGFLNRAVSPYFAATPANGAFFFLILLLQLAFAFGLITLCFERLVADLKATQQRVTAEVKKRTELKLQLAKAERRAELQLAADLDGMTRLHNLGTLFVREGDLRLILGEVLEAAIAIAGADFGNIQLIDPATARLRIVAQRGFPQWYVDFWNEACLDPGACGTALERGERIIVEDVEQSPIFMGTPSLEIQLKVGIRGVQSTPLMGWSEKMLGMFSTHYKKPYRPDARALRLLDLLARQAADIIERGRTEEAIRLSENRFRALVTATSDIVYSMSPDWSEMHQLQGKAFLADTNTPSRTWLQKYILPEDQAHVMSAIRKATRDRRAFELEHRVLRADGSLGWTFSRAIPLLDADGEITEWFGAASDVTGRKRAEEVWLSLSAIVESSSDAIIGRTLDDKITSWNSGAERLYGYSAAEVLGRPISLLLPPNFPNDMAGITRKVANGERINDYETVRRRKDSSLVEVSLRVSPILDSAGKVVGASTIARDITERKRAQEARLRGEKLAATARLATTIAHEVNNPLAGAMNAIYIASVDPTHAGEMLKLADEELRRAAHITQQTLGFYRESSGQQQAAIPKVVEEVLTVYATKLRNRNITVQRRYHCGMGSRRGGCPEGCEGCERSFLVNAGELRQIISSLLANGIDALRDAGVMQIRASRLTDRIQLTMADNGCGIRTENLKRIFEPFYSTKEFGAGLGLWVTQELVHKYNGLIKVRSRKDRGTVFRLTFPQEKALRSGSTAGWRAA